MLIQITKDGKLHTYTYSSDNWRKAPAAMQNGQVVQWIPPEVQPGMITTVAGRTYRIIQQRHKHF